MLAVARAPGARRIVARVPGCRTNASFTWTPRSPATKDTPGYPYRVQAWVPWLVKVSSSYRVPAVPPPGSAATPTVRSAVWQRGVDRAGSTTGPAVGAVGAGAAAGGVDGAG